MKLKPATPEALQLLHEGAIAMARIERAGLRIDVAHLDNQIENVKKQIHTMEARLTNSKEYRLWAKHYGNGMKLDAPAQLGHIVFDLMGHKRNPFMENSNSEAAFEHLKVQFVRDHFEVKKLRNALTRSLMGIKSEVVDGFIHPFIDLHTAESMRSSSSRPNFQNLQVRNKAISEIVRSCIIPRKGHVLLEADYGVQEVRVSYCHNKDPKLRHDILTGDMHKDRAKEIYLLTEEELGPTNGKHPGRDVRYCSKNKFVFPQFYGSYYAQCAPDLWEAISQLDLKTVEGVSLFEHLKSKGIKRLGLCDPDIEPKRGTFEHHVRSVEHKMWQDTYTVYDKWKRDYWDLYLRKGGINTFTGFCLSGDFRRNQVLSYAIQGEAFHCLLWSIIQMQKEMIRNKMRSRIIMQIHDSCLLDVFEPESSAVIEMWQRIALKEVADHWKWIIIPLHIEFEIARENWYKKTTMEIAA